MRLGQLVPSLIVLAELRRRLVAPPFSLFAGVADGERFQRRVRKVARTWRPDLAVPGRRTLSAAGALRVAAAEMPAEALALPVTEAVHHDELAVYALESRRAGPLQRMIW